MDAKKAFDLAVERAEQEIDNCYPKHRQSEPAIRIEKLEIIRREYRILTGNL